MSGAARSLAAVVLVIAAWLAPGCGRVPRGSQTGSDTTTTARIDPTIQGLGERLEPWLELWRGPLPGVGAAQLERVATDTIPGVPQPLTEAWFVAQQPSLVYAPD